VICSIDQKTGAALNSNFDFEIEIQFHFQNEIPEIGDLLCPVPV
jgi:hypothetical protein